MFSLTANRLTRSYEQVKERFEALDPEAQASLDREMAVSFEEHFSFQETQAWAHVSGILDTDEAQIVYVALGEVGDPGNGGWASETDTPTKVVVTLLMGQLLKMKIARHGR
jgi:hypothetical protein